MNLVIYFQPDTVIASVFVVAILSYALRNRNRPPFEIDGDKLYIKTDWGSIREYPLKNFNGNIETIKHLGAISLLVPGFYTFTFGPDAVSLAGLERAERELLIKSLRESVSKSQD